MARRRKARGRVLGNIVHELANLIKGIRRAKDRLTGASWRRAHRIESELETLAGKKSPVKRPLLLGTLPTKAALAKLLAENKKLKDAAKK